MPVTTRNQQGLAQEVVSPQTPSKNQRRPGQIGEFLNNFCRLLSIELPIYDVTSPDARTKSTGHEIVNNIKYLYWNGRDALDRAVVELSTCTPKVQMLDEPLTVVLDKLNQAAIAVKREKTPHAKLRMTPLTTGNSQRLRNAQTDSAEAPPSPTLAVKHLPRNATTAACGVGTVLPDYMTSAKTSFATTLFGTTSFGTTSFMSDSTNLNKSFMSDGTKASQSTAATSVYSAHEPSQESEFPMSSLDPGIASQLETAAAVPSEVLTAKDVPVGEVSPSKPQNYRVANIPSDGLAQQHLPPTLLSLPFDLRIEAYRVMRACGLSAEQMEMQSRYTRSFTTLQDLVEKFNTKKPFHPGRKTNFSDSTLCARLRWSEAKSGPLFDLELYPPRREDLHSFQRNFGSDRILIVDLPSLSKPPFGLSRPDIETRLREMLSQDQQFLGRTWVQYHIQDKKRKKTADVDSTKPGTYQISFFAVSGDGLKDISIPEFLEWFIPFQLNAEKPAGKVYARLDLGASRSKPTLEFETDQIIYNVPDKLATDVDDKDKFRDPDPKFLFLEQYDPNTVMNDGCSEISIAAMDAVRQKLGLGYIPAVVQGRIFGAKGVWYRSKGDLPSDPTPADVWIKIAKSQIKAQHELHDDEELLTLNVVGYSRSARSSLLYPGFLPILVDRGVQQKAILDIARQQVQLDTEEYLAALQDPRALHQWIHQQKDLLDTRHRKSGIWEVAGFPVTHEERVCQMLESGFEPSKCRFLAKEIIRIGEQVFDLKAKMFKVHLNLSTSLIGIADPYDCLEPDEIHVCFSSPFKDKLTKQTWMNLNGKFVLIARNPALRNSDIRKYRVVNKPELGHLQDVVVFSTRGRRAGASMLSGGDYDGDTFWVCWDPTLVEPFLNAPAPWVLAPLEHFGIEKDTLKLGEIAGDRKPRSWDEPTARKWIQRSTASRMEFNQLGVVTLTHGDLTYADNNVSSVNATRLVDLHDWLVDADKQGLHYTGEAWADYKQRFGIPKRLPVPAYRAFTSHDETEPEAFNVSRCNPKPDSVIDQLYFGVVKPEVDATIAKARAMVEGAPVSDDDLTKSFDQAIASAADKSVIQTELQALQARLLEVRKLWYVGMRKYHSTGKKPADWQECVVGCRAAYVAILPTNTTHDVMIEWLRRRGNALTIWDEMKASALAKFEYGSGRILFSVAGDELCRLKAQAADQTRVLRLPIYLPMKPHARRTGVEAIENSDAETETDESEYHERESIFDDLDVPTSPTSPSRKRKSSPGMKEAKRMTATPSSSSAMRGASRQRGRQAKREEAATQVEGNFEANEQARVGADEHASSEDEEAYLFETDSRKPKTRARPHQW